MKETDLLRRTRVVCAAVGALAVAVAIEMDWKVLRAPTKLIPVELLANNSTLRINQNNEINVKLSEEFVPPLGKLQLLIPSLNFSQETTAEELKNGVTVKDIYPEAAGKFMLQVKCNDALFVSTQLVAPTEWATAGAGDAKPEFILDCENTANQQGTSFVFVKLFAKAAWSHDGKLDDFAVGQPVKITVKWEDETKHPQQRELTIVGAQSEPINVRIPWNAPTLFRFDDPAHAGNVKEFLIDPSKRFPLHLATSTPVLQRFPVGPGSEVTLRIADSSGQQIAAESTVSATPDNPQIVLDKNSDLLHEFKLATFVVTGSAPGVVNFIDSRFGCAAILPVEITDIRGFLLWVAIAAALTFLFTNAAMLFSVSYWLSGATWLTLFGSLAGAVLLALAWMYQIVPLPAFAGNQMHWTWGLLVGAVGGGLGWLGVVSIINLFRPAGGGGP